MADSHEPPTPIAAVNPGLLVSLNRSIRGEIVLVWPYSSFTKSTALLIAEKDARLRRNHGQVRVLFNGHAAKAVARSGAGIGDEVQVSLNGAHWQQVSTSIRTPGKSVDGELVFRNKLQLTIISGFGQLGTISVDEPPSPHSSSPTSTPQHFPTTDATPQPRRRSSPTTWSSPNILRLPAGVSRSSAFSDSNESQTLDQDDIPSRKRFRIDRSSGGRWKLDNGHNLSLEDETSDVARIASHPPSSPLGGSNVPLVMSSQPYEMMSQYSSQNSLPPIGHSESVQLVQDSVETRPESTLSTLDPFSQSSNESFVTAAVGTSQTGSQNQTLFASMRPPPLPSIRTTTDPASEERDYFTSRPTQDPLPPRLGPVASPGLPLVSPFPSTPLEERAQAQQAWQSALYGGRESHTQLQQTESTLRSQISETMPASFPMSQPVESQLPNESQILAANESQLDSQISSELSHSQGRFSLDQDQYAQGSIGIPSLESSTFANAQGLVQYPSLPSFPDDLSSAYPESTAASLEPLDASQSDAEPAFQPASQSALQIVPQSAPVIDLVSADGDEPNQPDDTHRILPPPSDEAAKQSKSFAIFGEQTSSKETEASGSTDSIHAQPPIDLSASNDSKEAIDTPHSKPRGLSTKPRLSRTSEIPASLQQWFSPKIGKPQDSTEAQEPVTTGQEDLNLPTKTVPDSLKQWSSPRPKADSASQSYSTRIEPPAQVDKENPVSEKLEESRPGFRTSQSYYVPLRNLRSYLNIPPIVTPMYVDVLAAVSSSSSKPTRAEKGPRDFFTLLHVADGSTEPVQVQCLRPRFAALPEATVGDVVLLRNFSVRSRDHHTFLQSAGPSSWCVWRISNLLESEGLDSVLDVQSFDSFKKVQECKGPPVEIGEDEYDHVKRMRQLWEHSLSQNGHQKIAFQNGN